MVKQVHIEAFNVSGPSIRTTNKAEMSPFAKIPNLWGLFYASHTSQGQPIYSAYSDYESDATGEFTVTAGTRVAEGTKPSVGIKSGTYLVFPANGVMPAAIIDAWKVVWEHFSSNQSYVRAYETDFEEYIDPESAAIYIGINASS